MPKMNPELRAIAIGVLDARQKADCKKLNIEYAGPYCEEGKYKKIDKDGHACKGILCVDHIDNNNNNNPRDGRNWQYLCRGHNGRKNHRQASRKPKLFEFQDLKESLKRGRRKEDRNERGDEIEEVVIRFAEMDKNKKASPVFREFVSMVLDGVKHISKKDLLDAGAEYVTQVLGDGCGIDQQTAERYLKKLCAPFVGKFEIYNRNEKEPGLKPEWWVRSRREEE